MCACSLNPLPYSRNGNDETLPRTPQRKPRPLSATLTPPVQCTPPADPFPPAPLTTPTPTPPSCAAPQTFMSNMLQAVSILYKTKLPLLLVGGGGFAPRASFFEGGAMGRCLAPRVPGRGPGQGKGFGGEAQAGLLKTLLGVFLPNPKP